MMLHSKIRKQVMSVYTVILLIISGFMGILVIEGVFDFGGVDAATQYVGPGQTYSTIGAAITAATAGDTIRVYAGTYNENIVVNKRLTLIGNGTTTTTINGGGSGDVVRITANLVSMSGFKVTNSDSEGIELYGVSNCVIFDNLCTFTYVGILLHSSSSNTVYDNSGSSNTWAIYLYSSSSNTIRDNTCSSNTYDGIGLDGANSNTITNNTCNSNSDDGIQMRSSSSNTIRDNTIRWNTGDGFYLYTSANRNTIASNIASNNGNDGIGVYSSSSNTIKDNSFSSNSDDGIHLRSSLSNKLINNTCNSNTQEGIILDTSSNSNTITDNTCKSNRDGISISNSKWNTVDNNTCNSNLDDSFYLFSSTDNIISNNTCNSNSDKGIVLEAYCNRTIIKKNTCTSNTNDGIWLFASFGCTVSNNTCSNNGYGIYLGSSIGNYIFHNSFISNTQQARNDNVNYFNNSQQEGNYWSDYTGVDDGSGTGKHAIAGDGIGDTKIPHPGTGFDYYPFTKALGWLYPENPKLTDPGDLVIDGNYTITWKSAQRTTGYVLEEDTSDTFTTSTELYNGSGLTFQFINKPNGTYYYRLKGYNEYHKSKWSNVVDIKVDWPPTSPTNLTAQNATGHNITLTWSLNPELDINGYHIYINETNTGPSGPYKWLHTTSSSATQYIVTSLNEETTYFFVIAAFDEVPTNSTYSNIASATTLDVTAPEPPTGLEANPISGTEISLSWNSNQEQDLAGYLIYMNDTNDDPLETFTLIHTIIGTGTSHTVTDLSEEVTYYFKLKAFDEVPNNSSFSDYTSATTPDETMPSPPTGLNVSNPTNNSLTISWDANPEPDVVGYFLYRNTFSLGKFDKLNTELLTQTQYIDTGLDENTIYYYKVKAVDEVPLISEFSEVASGTTLLGPYAPEINNSLTNLVILEDHYDDTSINLYHCFKDVNCDPLKFRCTGNTHLNVTIFDQNGTVILKPEKDWSGREYLTFYANDSVFDEISDTVTITVTPINDPPETPQISAPKAGITIEEGIWLDFIGHCSDPDLPYGDRLKFEWSSNVSGKFGEGMSMKSVLLAPGAHEITLKVSDIDGETSIATIDFTVKAKETNVTEPDKNDTINNETGNNDTGKNDTTTNTTDGEDLTPTKGRQDGMDWIISVLILIIVVIIIVILLFFMQLKKKKRTLERLGVPEVLEPVSAYKLPDVPLTRTGSAEPRVIESKPILSIPTQELVKIASPKPKTPSKQLPTQPPATRLPPRQPPQPKPPHVSFTQPRAETRIEKQKPVEDTEYTPTEKMEMLEERFLYGEISEDTYLKLKAKYDLEAKPYQPTPRLPPGENQ